MRAIDDEMAFWILFCASLGTSQTKKTNANNVYLPNASMALLDSGSEIRAVAIIDPSAKNNANMAGIVNKRFFKGLIPS